MLNICSANVESSKRSSNINIKFLILHRCCLQDPCYVTPYIRYWHHDNEIRADWRRQFNFNCYLSNLNNGDVASFCSHARFSFFKRPKIWISDLTKNVWLSNCISEQKKEKFCDYKFHASKWCHHPSLIPEKILRNLLSMIQPTKRPIDQLALSESPRTIQFINPTPLGWGHVERTHILAPKL